MNRLPSCLIYPVVMGNKESYWSGLNGIQQKNGHSQRRAYSRIPPVSHALKEFLSPSSKKSCMKLCLTVCCRVRHWDKNYGVSGLTFQAYWNSPSTRLVSEVLARFNRSLIRITITSKSIQNEFFSAHSNRFDGQQKTLTLPLLQTSTPPKFTMNNLRMSVRHFLRKLRSVVST